MSACHRCVARGTMKNTATPKCAFESGTFSGNNFLCATSTALRDLLSTGFEVTAGVAASYVDDTTFVSVPIDIESIEGAAFMIMSWYKRRGCTDVIAIVYEGVVAPITLAQAEEAIPALERALHGVVATPPGVA